MNIKIIIIKRLGSPIIEISTLLNPVVVEADIDWNKEKITESSSEKKIIMNPINIKIVVSKKLNFVYTESFFCSLL
jgi:hypothetical protein